MLYIQLIDEPVVLTQEMKNIDYNGFINVDLDKDGRVAGIEMSNPGNNVWPIGAILGRYPMPVNHSFMLVALAERKSFFQFNYAEDPESL